jgi:hypothetical protein
MKKRKEDSFLPMLANECSFIKRLFNFFCLFRFCYVFGSGLHLFR